MSEITIEGEEVLERTVKSFGDSGAHITVPKSWRDNEVKVVRVGETESKPNSKAVIVRIRDTSGSITDDEFKLTSSIFMNTEWFFKGQYETIEFINICYAEQAVVVDEEDFFTKENLGGSKLSKAYNLANEKLEEYGSDWDRFTVTIDDGAVAEDILYDKVIPLLENPSSTIHFYFQLDAFDSNKKFKRTYDGFTSELDDTETVIPARLEDAETASDTVKETLARVLK